MSESIEGLAETSEKINDKAKWVKPMSQLLRLNVCPILRALDVQMRQLEATLATKADVGAVPRAVEERLRHLEAGSRSRGERGALLQPSCANDAALQRIEVSLWERMKASTLQHRHALEDQLRQHEANAQLQLAKAETGNKSLHQWMDTVDRQLLELQEDTIRRTLTSTLGSTRDSQEQFKLVEMAVDTRGKHWTRDVERRMQQLQEDLTKRIEAVTLPQVDASAKLLIGDLEMKMQDLEADLKQRLESLSASAGSRMMSQPERQEANASCREDRSSVASRALGTEIKDRSSVASRALGTEIKDKVQKFEATIEKRTTSSLRPSSIERRDAGLKSAIPGSEAQERMERLEAKVEQRLQKLEAKLYTSQTSNDAEERLQGLVAEGLQQMQAALNQTVSALGLPREDTEERLQRVEAAVVRRSPNQTLSQDTDVRVLPDEVTSVASTDAQLHRLAAEVKQQLTVEGLPPNNDVERRLQRLELAEAQHLEVNSTAAVDKRSQCSQQTLGQLESLHAAQQVEVAADGKEQARYQSTVEVVKRQDDLEERLQTLEQQLQRREPGSRGSVLSSDPFGKLGPLLENEASDVHRRSSEVLGKVPERKVKDLEEQVQTLASEVRKHRRGSAVTLDQESEGRLRHLEEALGQLDGTFASEEHLQSVEQQVQRLISSRARLSRAGSAVTLNQDAEGRLRHLEEALGQLDGTFASEEHLHSIEQQVQRLISSRARLSSSGSQWCEDVEERLRCLDSAVKNLSVCPSKESDDTAAEDHVSKSRMESTDHQASTIKEQQIQTRFISGSCLPDVLESRLGHLENFISKLEGTLDLRKVRFAGQADGVVADVLEDRVEFLAQQLQDMGKRVSIVEMKTNSRHSGMLASQTTGDAKEENYLLHSGESCSHKEESSTIAQSKARDLDLNGSIESEHQSAQQMVDNLGFPASSSEDVRDQRRRSCLSEAIGSSRLSELSTASISARRDSAKSYNMLRDDLHKMVARGSDSRKGSCFSLASGDAESRIRNLEETLVLLDGTYASEDRLQEVEDMVQKLTQSFRRLSNSNHSCEELERRLRNVEDVVKTKDSLSSSLHGDKSDQTDCQLAHVAEDPTLDSSIQVLDQQVLQLSMDVREKANNSLANSLQNRLQHSEDAIGQLEEPPVHLMEDRAEHSELPAAFEKDCSSGATKISQHPNVSEQRLQLLEQKVQALTGNGPLCTMLPRLEERLYSVETEIRRRGNPAKNNSTQVHSSQTASGATADHNLNEQSHGTGEAPGSAQHAASSDALMLAHLEERLCSLEAAMQEGKVRAEGNSMESMPAVELHDRSFQLGAMVAQQTTTQVQSSQTASGTTADHNLTEQCQAAVGGFGRKSALSKQSQIEEGVQQLERTMVQPERSELERPYAEARLEKVEGQVRQLVQDLSGIRTGHVDGNAPHFLTETNFHRERDILESRLQRVEDAMMGQLHSTDSSLALVDQRLHKLEANFENLEDLVADYLDTSMVPWRERFEVRFDELEDVVNNLKTKAVGTPRATPRTPRPDDASVLWRNAMDERMRMLEEGSRCSRRRGTSASSSLYILNRRRKAISNLQDDEDSEPEEDTAPDGQVRDRLDTLENVVMNNTNFSWRIESEDRFQWLEEQVQRLAQMQVPSSQQPEDTEVAHLPPPAAVDPPKQEQQEDSRPQLDIGEYPSKQEVQEICLELESRVRERVGACVTRWSADLEQRLQLMEDGLMSQVQQMSRELRATIGKDCRKSVYSAAGRLRTETLEAVAQQESKDNTHVDDCADCDRDDVDNAEAQASAEQPDELDLPKRNTKRALTFGETAQAITRLASFPEDDSDEANSSEEPEDEDCPDSPQKAKAVRFSPKLSQEFRRTSTDPDTQVSPRNSVLSQLSEVYTIESEGSFVDKVLSDGTKELNAKSAADARVFVPKVTLRPHSGTACWNSELSPPSSAGDSRPNSGKKLGPSPSFSSEGPLRATPRITPQATPRLTPGVTPRSLPNSGIKE